MSHYLLPCLVMHCLGHPEEVQLLSRTSPCISGTQEQAKCVEIPPRRNENPQKYLMKSCKRAGGTWRWLFMFQIVRPATPIASILCFTAVGFASKELGPLNSTSSVSSRNFRSKEQKMNRLASYASKELRELNIQHQFHREISDPKFMKQKNCLTENELFDIVCSKFKKPNHEGLLDTLQLQRRSYGDHQSSEVNSLSAALPWEGSRSVCPTCKKSHCFLSACRWTSFCESSSPCVSKDQGNQKSLYYGTLFRSKAVQTGKYGCVHQDDAEAGAIPFHKKAGCVPHDDAVWLCVEIL